MIFKMILSLERETLIMLDQKRGSQFVVYLTLRNSVNPFVEKIILKTELREDWQGCI